MGSLASGRAPEPNPVSGYRSIPSRIRSAMRARSNCAKLVRTLAVRGAPGDLLREQEGLCGVPEGVSRAFSVDSGDPKFALGPN